jgi:molybdopterin-guanine dinucleotide biosynthesis protein MobB
VKHLKPHPYIVCVTGLKNSGKTTVCTALIADLDARGYTVAALKSSHIAKLTLDSRSGDSFSLAESGACFVLVQGPEESLTFERGGRSFAQMLQRVPEGVDFIVSEGGDPQAAGSVIVCLVDPADWEESLRVRGVPRNRILAVSGLFAGAEAGGHQTFENLPLCDANRKEDIQILAERIIESARRAGLFG